ncbi:MAG: BrnT family toxin [Gammaproteobacteria bacterium]
MFYTITSFEFDRDKSQVNLLKHGIDFARAQLLWDDPNLIEVQARSDDEPRSLVVAQLDGKTWSAVITGRDDRVRIISVRRARPAEVALYES